MTRDEGRAPDEVPAEAAEQALAWFVRLKDPSATAADRWAFRQWAELSPLHRRAFAETEALWGRLEQPAARVGAGGWYRRTSKAAGGWRPRLAGALALAATVLVTVGGAWWHDPGMIDRALADHSTARGERREVALADGSKLVLDGDSAVSVTLDGAERRIELRRGRLWVDVAHKDGVGFRVQAGTVVARVLGTAFAVDRRDDAVSVTVERGRVAVLPHDRTEGGVVVTAGQRVEARDGRIPAPQAVATETALAWRRGLIVFDRAPLREVVEALDRNSRGRVVLTDAALENLTLSGVFRSDDPDAVLGALRSALGLRTGTVPGIVTWIHR
ncbi:MAG: FecR family protein [Alphaproteobacteria bacterium]